MEELKTSERKGRKKFFHKATGEGRWLLLLIGEEKHKCPVEFVEVVHFRSIKKGTEIKKKGDIKKKTVA